MYEPSWVTARGRKAVIAAPARMPHLDAEHPFQEPLITRPKYAEGIARMLLLVNMWQDPPMDPRRPRLIVTRDGLVHEPSHHREASIAATLEISPDLHLVVYTDRTALLAERAEGERFRPFPVVLKLSRSFTPVGGERTYFFSRIRNPEDHKSVSLALLRSHRSSLAVGLDGQLHPKVPEIDDRLREQVREALKREAASWAAALSEAEDVDEASASRHADVEIWPAVFLTLRKYAIPSRYRDLYKDLSDILSSHDLVSPGARVSILAPHVPQDGSRYDSHVFIEVDGQGLYNEIALEIVRIASSFNETVARGGRMRFTISPPVPSEVKQYPEAVGYTLPLPASVSNHHRLQLASRHPSLSRRTLVPEIRGKNNWPELPVSSFFPDSVRVS